MTQGYVTTKQRPLEPGYRYLTEIVETRHATSLLLRRFALTNESLSMTEQEIAPLSYSFSFRNFA
jgi:hypothetical protein